MKKFLSMLLVLVFIGCVVPTGTVTASAAHKYLSTMYTGNAAPDAPKSEWRYAVFAGDIEKMPTKVVVPSKIDGVIVSEIAPEGFAYAWYLQSVTIPGSVQTIRCDAFYGCYALKDVTLNNGIKTIDDYAFGRCDALKSITIPSSVTEFGYDVFYNTPVTIHCHSGSQAENYAKENGINYKNVHFWKLASKTKASTTKNGSAKYKCTECNKTKTVTTYAPKTYKLSKTSAAYSGNAKKPSVKIYDKKGNLIPSSNYTVTYKNNKKVGKATAKITFKGFYKGTKTLSFNVVPKATFISNIKLSGNKKSAKVTLKKQTTQTSGYQIQYSTSSNFKNAKSKYIKNPKTTSVTLKGLNAKKTYYVRVRSYKKIGTKRYNSDWSWVITSKNKPLLGSQYKALLNKAIKNYPKSANGIFGDYFACEFSMYEKPGLSDASYVLKDINKDGTYELILFAGQSICKIYTIYNGKAVQLIERGVERAHVNVCADGTIMYSGNSGAGQNAYSIRTISNGTLKTKYGLSSDLVDDGEHIYVVWTYTAGSKTKKLTESQAYAKIDAMKTVTFSSRTTLKQYKKVISK